MPEEKKTENVKNNATKAAATKEPKKEGTRRAPAKSKAKATKEVKDKAASEKDVEKTAAAEAAAAASVPTPEAAAAAAAQQPQVVATFMSSDGKRIGLNAAQLGRIIKDNYGKMSFPYFQVFWNYQRAHIMNEVIARLKKDMDAVSCNYIDHHERLMNVAYVSDITLVNNNALWTPVDHKLLLRNKQMVAANNPPFLQQVNLEWSSSFTNFYGMYDLPIELLKRVNGKAIVEGGGFIGDTIALFRALFPESVVHSFEPVKANYNTLTNLFEEALKSGKVIAHQQGLGSKAGKMRMSKVQGESDAMASLKIDYNVKELYEEVEITTVDDYVKANKLEVGLIKMDVEGFEPEIIAGALETIKEQKPLLVIGNYHTPEEYYELKPYLESLNLGYKFAIRRSNFSASPLCDTVLIAYQE